MLIHRINNLLSTYKTWILYPPKKANPPNIALHFWGISFQSTDFYQHIPPHLPPPNKQTSKQTKHKTRKLLSFILLSLESTKTENADIVRETMLKHEMHANFTTLQQFHKPLLQNKAVTFITPVLIKKSYLEFLGLRKPCLRLISSQDFKDFCNGEISQCN